MLRPDQFDDNLVIETFENSPAYNREKRVADGVRNSTPRNPSAPQSQQPGVAASTQSPSGFSAGNSGSDSNSQSRSNRIEF